ncbi:MAG: PAS domain S-box protein [Pseudanabaena sp. CAN_BIN31]|nr:PAS domain S-box protein [Pseudanabaena sp. CAN_BIN31]
MTDASIDQKANSETNIRETSDLLALESDRLFKSIMENVADLIAVIDAQGYRIYNSPSYQRVLGYSFAELQGTWAYDKIHPDDREQVLETAVETLKTGVGKTLEYRMQHKDGSWRILESSGSVMRDQQGNVQNIVIVAHDISDRKKAQWERLRAERELERSRQSYKELVRREEMLNRRLASQIRNSLDLNTIIATAVNEVQDLLLIDLCNFFWYVPDTNPPEFELVHFAASHSFLMTESSYPLSQLPKFGQRLLSQEIIQIQSIYTNPELDEVSQTILAERGFTSQVLMPIKTRSQKLGVIVAAHCQGSRPWNADEVELLQSVANQLAIAIDQAELFDFAQANAAQANAQALLTEKALADLQKAQSQLIQTEKMSGLGQLVAGVAHEINNPVNFIYGNLNYANRFVHNLLEAIALYQKNYPEPIPEIAKFIDEIDLEFLRMDLPKMLTSMKIGAERIRQIVLSLRNFSRIDEEGRKPFNIHEGLDSTLLILQNRFKAYGDRPAINLTKHYGNIPIVNAYGGQLNQVFMNILSNAIDAIDESLSSQDAVTDRIVREISIITELKLPTSDSSQPMVVIHITDNGHGISEGILKKLFDPFFTTKPVGKGTGLGLSISYQIVVEKHQGKLECSSTVGEGSEFRIEIPV